MLVPRKCLVHRRQDGNEKTDLPWAVSRTVSEGHVSVLVVANGVMSVPCFLAKKCRLSLALNPPFTPVKSSNIPRAGIWTIRTFSFVFIIRNSTRRCFGTTCTTKGHLHRKTNDSNQSASFGLFRSRVFVKASYRCASRADDKELHNLGRQASWDTYENDARFGIYSSSSIKGHDANIDR